jgi:hypothetical protein
VDHVGNKEEPGKYNFYFDKTAPIVAADILGDRFYANDQVYFSGRTKLKITAVDNKVGVKEVRYSIDNGEYQLYDQPFYLPSVSGIHYVRYYSIDNLSNKSQNTLTGMGPEEFKHNVNKIYVDLTGPDINYTLTGKSRQTRDTLFVSSNTQIVLIGNDKESGLQKLTYSIGGDQEEITYTAPFRLVSPGYQLVEFFGYDNVNNRNLSQFYAFVDDEAPSIFHNFSVSAYANRESLSVYPRDVSLFLGATDKHVGLADIFYRVGNGTFKPYAGRVTGFAKGKNQLDVKAVDLLGNERTESIEFYIE